MIFFPDLKKMLPKLLKETVKKKKKKKKKKSGGGGGIYFGF